MLLDCGTAVFVEADDELIEGGSLSASPLDTLGFPLWASRPGFGEVSGRGIDMSGVPRLPTGADFGKMKWLKSVTLPDGIEELPASLFAGCYNLAAVCIRRGGRLRVIG